MIDCKSIFVDCSDDSGLHARFAAVRQIARRFGAQVTGVSTTALPASACFVAGKTAAVEISRDYDRLRSELDRREKQFREAMKGYVDQLEWRAEIDSPTRYMVDQARAADLIVASTILSNAAPSYQSLNTSEVVMACARPVLVVPPKMERFDLQTILVAWRDSREARRALSDALPFLAAAEKIQIMEAPESTTDRDRIMKELHDVKLWLSCRGIASRISISEQDGRSPEEAIRAVASDVGATLIVAGAYGRSRLREWVFGGVTRSLLESEKLCSLLSH